jgi:hypothetical protein
MSAHAVPDDLRGASDEWEETRQAIRGQLLPGEKIETLCRRTGLPYIPTWELLNYRRAPSLKTVAIFREVLGPLVPLMPGEGRDFVTDTEAAEILGLSRAMVHRLKSKGVIKAVGPGNRVLYLRSTIEALRDERRRAAASRPKTLEARKCRRCRRDLPKRKQQKYCSRLCSNARKRPVFFPKTALGKDVNGLWEASGLGLTEFAKSACRIAVETLKKILKDEPIWSATFERLNETLGGDLHPPAQTINDIRSEEGKQRLEELGKKHPFKSAENRAKANETRRGSTRKPEAIAKQVLTHETSPRWAAHMENLHARKGSPEWHARLFLARLLRITRQPSDELLHQWLIEAVASFKELGFEKMTPEAMYSVWRRTLVKIGRLRPGGRPREEARHQIVIDLMAKRGLTPADSMPRGFWPVAFAAVRNAGEEGILDSHEKLSSWWDNHKRSCFACLISGPRPPAMG